MNFYQFLKSLQEGIGDGCKVYASPWEFMDEIHGMKIDVRWLTDEEELSYRFVVPEESLEADGFLEHFSKYTIEKAQREFRIWEVGEE